MTNVVSVQDFNERAQIEWGDVRRTQRQLFDRDVALIRDFVNLSDASNELKLHLADTILRESTPHCGALSDSSDASWFVHSFGHDISVIDPPFDGRRVPVMKAALMLLAHGIFNPCLQPNNSEQYRDLNLVFGMGGCGLASLYILCQLEYLFRVSCTYLDADGTIASGLPPEVATNPGLGGKKTGDRINQIQLAFLLYVHAQPDRASVALSQLESDLAIADRLAHIRPSAMHGHMGDASSEGIFYALLLAILFYGRSQQ